jgi:hypothetical protein
MNFKPSKLEIEALRLIRFSELLFMRSQLLYAGENLTDARRKGSSQYNDTYYVKLYLDKVWAAQQACIEYELKYPLER